MVFFPNNLSRIVLSIINHTPAFLLRICGRYVLISVKRQYGVIHLRLQPTLSFLYYWFAPLWRSL